MIKKIIGGIGVICVAPFYYLGKGLSKLNLTETLPIGFGILWTAAVAFVYFFKRNDMDTVERVLYIIIYGGVGIGLTIGLKVLMSITEDFFSTIYDLFENIFSGSYAMARGITKAEVDGERMYKSRMANIEKQQKIEEKQRKRESDFQRGYNRSRKMDKIYTQGDLQRMNEEYADRYRTAQQKAQRDWMINKEREIRLELGVKNQEYIQKMQKEKQEYMDKVQREKQEYMDRMRKEQQSYISKLNTDTDYLSAIKFFNLKKTYSASELKKSYHAILQVVHPDENKDNPKAKEISQLANEYYQLLEKRLKEKS